MTKPDPTLAQIAAQFTRHSVEKSGGAYLILDRPTNPCAPIAAVHETETGTLRQFGTLQWTSAAVGRPSVADTRSSRPHVTLS